MCGCGKPIKAEPKDDDELDELEPADDDTGN